MKPNILITVIVGIVLVAGGIVVSTRKNTTSVSPVDSEARTVSQEKQEVVAASMKDLVAKNKPLKCTFTQKTDMSTSEGTLYIAEGKVRGDFDISSSGQSFKAYMITDGTSSFVWSSILPQGFKVPLQNASNQASTQPTQGVDYNQVLDYDCSSWVVDSAVFIPPTNVTFITPPVTVPR